MLHTFLIATLGFLAGNSFLLADEPAKVGFRDDFIGKYDPAWQIINENPDNISLTKQPGMLTITSDYGGIYGLNRAGKNIFLIDNPMKEKTDFVVTTRIFGVDPEVNYQQAGLLCCDDLDNYLKFVFEFDSDNGGKSLSVVPEVEGVGLDNIVLKVDEKLNEVWLRIVKFDDEYLFSASRDGDEYKTIGKHKLGNGRPAQIGLITQNSAANTNTFDVHFDEFEIVPLETRPELKNLLQEEPFKGPDF